MSILTKAEIAKILKDNHGISYTESQIKHMSKDELTKELWDQVIATIPDPKSEKASHRRFSLKELFHKLFNKN